MEKGKAGSDDPTRRVRKFLDRLPSGSVVLDQYAHPAKKLGDKWRTLNGGTYTSTEIAGAGCTYTAVFVPAALVARDR